MQSRVAGPPLGLCPRTCAGRAGSTVWEKKGRPSPKAEVGKGGRGPLGLPGEQCESGPIGLDFCCAVA